MAAVLLRGLGPGVERGLAEVELHEHGESDGGESDDGAGDPPAAYWRAPRPNLLFKKEDFGARAARGRPRRPDDVRARLEARAHIQHPLGQQCLFAMRLLQGLGRREEHPTKHLSLDLRGH